MKRIYDSGPTFSLLKEAVQECISSAGASGSVSNEASVLLTIAVDALLKAGLVGNRAVAANPWSVVSSLARAFPLLLGSAAEAARSQAEQQARDDPSGTLLRLWVVEAAADGSLGILVDKVHSQPQIFTAYGRDAPIRDRVSTAELKRLVEPLKGLNFSGDHTHDGQAAQPAELNLHAAASADLSAVPCALRPETDLSDSHVDAATPTAHAAVPWSMQQPGSSHPAACSSAPQEHVRLALSVSKLPQDQATRQQAAWPVSAKLHILPAGSHVKASNLQQDPVLAEGGLSTSIRGAVWSAWEKAASTSNAALNAVPGMVSQLPLPAGYQQGAQYSKAASPEVAMLHSQHMRAQPLLVRLAVEGPVNEQHVVLTITASEAKHKSPQQGAAGREDSSVEGYRLASWVRHFSHRAMQQQTGSPLPEQHLTSAAAAAAAATGGKAEPEAPQAALQASSRPLQAEAASPTLAEQAQLQAAEELADQVCGIAQGIVELGMSSQDPLSPSALVDKLLKLLQALLSHGLLSQPLSQQHTWTAMLPGRQPSPLAILQAVAAADTGMGMDEGVVNHPVSSAAKVQMWLRKSLNEQALGTRMLALSHSGMLLRDHYHRWAAVRQEEVVGRVLGMLTALDGIRFLLPVDASPEYAEPAQGPAAVSHRAGQLLQTVGHALARYPINMPALRRPFGQQDTAAAALAGRPGPALPATSANVVPRLPTILAGGLADSFSGSLLSPLSSEDLSAQPLSPATLAFLQSMQHAQPELREVLAEQADSFPEAWELPSPQPSPSTLEVSLPHGRLSLMSHTTSPDFDAHDSHAAFLQELLGADRQSHAPEHGAAANAHPAVDEDTNDVVQLSEFSRPTAHPSAADMSVPSSFDMASQVSQDSSFHHMTTLQELMPTQSASSMDSMALQHPPAVQPPMQQSATAPSSALSERDETVTSFSDPLAHPPVPHMLPVTEHDMHQRSASSSRAVGDVRPASAAASSVDYASQMSADADDASSVEDLSNVGQLPKLDSPSLAHAQQQSDESGSGSPVTAQTMPAMSVVIVNTRVKQQGSSNSTFTQYVVEVTNKSGESWQVAHRFSDYITLRSQLKLVTEASLPESWANLGKARSITGNSRMMPEVVSARREMLQRCLQDIVAAPAALASHPALLQFLGAPAPQDTASLHVLEHAPLPLDEDASSGPELSMGSRVRLLTALQPRRSDAQLLQLQQGLCAGCQGELGPGAASSWKWGFTSAAPAKAMRWCHYMGLLYCPDCHSADTIEIPACVLHAWDFTRYPVCDLALEFLRSIHDQPLLCVSAANPGLYARIPVLAKARHLRVSACAGITSACSASIAAKLQAEKLLDRAGHRRYLLESTEFWAMRELVELSKGAFSSLPGWLAAMIQHAASLTLSAPQKAQ